MKRRTFLKASAGAMGIFSLGGLPEEVFANCGSCEGDLPFEISLAQWSLNKRLFGRAEPKLDNLDFAATSRRLGIGGLEYVNQFFMDKAQDKAYLRQMNKRAADNGCKNVLIMCDSEGSIGDPDTAKRIQAVKNHYKWLEAAKFLGCHSIRVNAHSTGTYDEQLKLAADGLARLSEYAAKYKLNVIVENHGGLSSNGQWLTSVIKKVNLPNCGTLPDFGNFQEYDRYKGVEEMMPFAKGVSAKAGKFDENGDEANTDFYRMMRLVRDAGYTGYVGIESGGPAGKEEEAIIKTKKLLEKIRKQQMQCKPIFNGKNLDGWTAIEGGEWKVENGTLVGCNGINWTTNPEKSGSWLHTNKQYADFRLELQVNLGPRSNSGVFLRSALEKNPAFTGYEMQLYDAPGREPSTSGPGALYDVVAPTKNMIRKANQWNTVTITARGPKITVEMNGERILDTNQTRSMKGHIGLQNHDGRSVVKYRNIRIEEL
jgi:L-ribulose-5-phosphate 3-epimerase